MAVSDLPLPPPALRFMAEDDEQFVRVGTILAESLRAHGLRDEGRILDVGCGYARLVYGLHATGFRGVYRGFDILRKQVGWCQENLTGLTRHQYTFAHLDVRNGRYNPDGEVSPAELRFPAEPGTYDCCSVFSVFTHMYEADIRRYLSEIARVMAHGGVAVVSWFLWDEDRLPAVTSSRSRFPLVNEINAVTRYANPKDPLHAIGYEREHVARMVADAGLAIQATALGSWTGEPGDGFQDTLALVHADEPRAEHR